MKRRHTGILESCYKYMKIKVCPIVDWTEEDVWAFIKERGLPYNPLYSQGYKRIGCVGCPQSKNMQKELEANPKFKALYFSAAEKHICYRNARGLRKRDESAEAYFGWWVGNKRKKEEDYLYD